MTSVACGHLCGDALILEHSFYIQQKSLTKCERCDATSILQPTFKQCPFSLVLLRQFKELWDFSSSFVTVSRHDKEKVTEFLCASFPSMVK